MDQFLEDFHKAPSGEKAPLPRDFYPDGFVNAALGGCQVVVGEEKIKKSLTYKKLKELKLKELADQKIK